MNIDVIGGTYFEECFEPHWREIYGSGLRGALTAINLGRNLDVTLHTFGDTEVKNHLQYLQSVFKSLQYNVKNIDNSLTFKYDFPLAEPLIYPRLDTISKKDIFCEADNIILFGTLEGFSKVKGKKVVYDPQSPVSPVIFSKTGSEAERLVIITNLSEAKLYTGENDIESIKKKFFSIEKAEAIVIKDGPNGAYIFTIEEENATIPAYQTPTVWSIGSGDVFTSSFAYHWMIEENTLIDSAKKASYDTAQYCSSKQLIFEKSVEFKAIGKKEKKGNIYLAGPFFTFSQRWLIQQFRVSLKEMGINVFSPWHDIGFGLAEDVAPLDIEAIERSDVLLAVVDGLDSGTLFEIGYARAKNIPVVAYVENETTDALKMLEGTNCKIFKDLTTAIYNSVWELYTYE